MPGKMNFGLSSLTLALAAWPSRLQPPSGAKDPRQNPEADGNEQRREPEARGDTDVALAVEAPTEAADEVDHGIEQADCAPERRQHVDRVERAAEESERRHHQRGDDRRVLDAHRHEQRRGYENDEPDADRFGRRRADIGADCLERGYGRREQLVDLAGEL